MGEDKIAVLLAGWNGGSRTSRNPPRWRLSPQCVIVSRPLSRQRSKSEMDQGN